MKDNQIGILSVRVKAIWLEAVKMYGNSPKKLFIKINVKILIMIIVLPVKEEGPRSVLNSR
jgi:hypothetical protein